MRSKNPIYEEDPKDTSINKTVDITNLDFVGIEIKVTPWNIIQTKTDATQ